MSGCELVRCAYYIGGKCTDTEEFVNESGEPVCRLRDDAVLSKEYYGVSCPECERQAREIIRLKKVADAARTLKLKLGSKMGGTLVIDLRDVAALGDALRELDEGGTADD